MLTKNSFLDEINKQYVLTARAKGLTENRVLYGHVFRNAMLIVDSPASPGAVQVQHPVSRGVGITSSRCNLVLGSTPIGLLASRSGRSAGDYPVVCFVHAHILLRTPELGLG